MEKDFRCDKDLLKKYMKYFEKYLTEATSVDDIDISVHCDIKIFEWLLRYLSQRDQKSDNSPFSAKHVQYKKKTDEEKKQDREANDQLD
jgi:hypothetical protein